MTIREYLAEKLKADGFDGLAGEYCGCGVEDLCPCDSPNPSACVPAYRWTCPEHKDCPIHGECEYEDEHVDCYSPKKPPIEECGQ